MARPPNSDVSADGLLGRASRSLRSPQLNAVPLYPTKGPRHLAFTAGDRSGAKRTSNTASNLWGPACIRQRIGQTASAGDHANLAIAEEANLQCSGIWMDKKKPVLADHKKRGKLLIPPFTYLVGPLQDVSWVRTMIPELCWIALIHEKHGSRHAVKLLTSFTRAVRETASATSHTWLAPCSNYLPVSEPEWSRLRESLVATGELFELQEALAPLVALYPDCPLRWIFTAAPTSSVDAEVTRMKGLIKMLFRRGDRDPMMAQASGLWLAFDAGILKAVEGTSLARFPEIHRYPETDISREIGGAIRSSLNMFFGTEHHYRPESSWPQYFWNRGLMISPCEFSYG